MIWIERLLGLNLFHFDTLEHVTFQNLIQLIAVASKVEF